MVLLEEFKDKVWPDIRSHLEEQKVEELETAAVMADDCALTHKMRKPGHTITNCSKLGGKTPCEHCGRFKHKSEVCKIAKNKL